MQSGPLTLEEAQSVCNAHQWLKGRKLFADKDWIIDEVAVAPADRLNQWLFVHLCLEGDTPKEALAFYRQPYYDVVLIAFYNRKEEGIAFKTIRSYLSDIGLPASYALYELNADLYKNRGIDPR